MRSCSLLCMKDRELYSKILGLASPWKVMDVDLNVEKGEVVVKAAAKPSTVHKCPKCGKKCGRYDSRRRRWRHLDTCQLQTILEAEVPRVQCPEHGVHLVDVPWAERGSKFTALFEAVVIHWLQAASIAAVAEQLELGWSQVNGIMARAVARGLARREAASYESIGVDETSFQKRHEYVTVVTDLEEGNVVHVADNRRTESLACFFEGLTPAQREAIEVVAMDMHQPYISATRKHLDDADRKIAFDKFHVAKSLGDAVNKVRREENKDLLAVGDRCLVGTRYLWLTNPDNMKDEIWNRAFKRLRCTLLRTARAWALKEEAMSLWRYKTLGWARRAWQRWLGWASRCRLDPIIKAARTIRRHLWGILNAIITGTTNATAESINAGIQRLKKRACGYRNRDTFRTAIYFHFGGLDLLPKGVATHTDY